MTDISKELGITMDLHQSGAPISVETDEQGIRRSRLQMAEEMQAMGAGGYRDIYALSEAADAPVTEAEVGGTVAGFVPGKAAGLVGAPGDIVALATGLYKAAFPDEDQGRLDAFITQVEDVSNKFGSGATLGFLDDWATQSGISDEVKQGFMQGAEVGSFFGFGQGAKATGKGVAAAGKAVAEGAPARIAERGEGVTLGMGADPMAPIDDAIVGAQKALQKPTKENPVTAVPPTETEPGIIAFHGSGADFDQFSLEKIGTGEGAQAYGYGLYFTDSEDIAKFYKDAVANQDNLYLQLDGKPIDSVYTQDNIDAHSDFLKNNFDINEYDDALTVLDNLGQGLNNLDDADAMAENSLNLSQYSVYEKIRDYLKEPELMQGKMYKVGLEPNPDDMLNYQTTFADQPKKVQDALKAIGYEVEKNRVGQKKPKSQIDLAMRRPMPMILDSLKGRIIEDIKAGEQDPGRADKILSEKLLEQGIPGIKYRAAGSRGASIDAADVKMNYVIFDDKAIKILEKYGIVGPVAITALGAAKQEGDEDASST